MWSIWGPPPSPAAESGSCQPSCDAHGAELSGTFGNAPPSLCLTSHSVFLCPQRGPAVPQELCPGGGWGHSQTCSWEHEWRCPVRRGECWGTAPEGHRDGRRAPGSGFRVISSFKCHPEELWTSIPTAAVGCILSWELQASIQVIENISA